jgi:tetratricopeptide (TPR) repeat protein
MKPNVYLISLSLILVLAGCWTQQDSITINIDGNVKFTSLITIPDEKKEFKIADINKICSDLLKQLGKSGWAAKKEWISEKRPYKLKFTGAGNLSKVSNRTDFYSVRKTAEEEYRIKFRTVGAGPRSISFDGNAYVFDLRGNKIKKIDNVAKDKEYIITAEKSKSIQLVSEAKVQDKSSEKALEIIRNELLNKQYLIECNGRWFSLHYYKSLSVLMMATSEGRVPVYNSLLELHKGKFVVTPNEITEIDKLNGITWDGYVGYQVKGMRYCPLDQGNRPKGKPKWSDWFDPGRSGSLPKMLEAQYKEESKYFLFKYRVQKRDNQWHHKLIEGVENRLTCDYVTEFMTSSLTAEKEKLPSGTEQILLKQYPLLSQKDPSNYRDQTLLKAKDTIPGKNKKAFVSDLTCLATIYTILERGRGNRDAMIDDYYDDPRGKAAGGIGAIAPPYITDKNVPLKKSEIKKALKEGQPVILKAEGEGNIGQHYVLAVGLKTTDDGKQQLIAIDTYPGKNKTVPAKELYIDITKETIVHPTMGFTFKYARYIEPKLLRSKAKSQIISDKKISDLGFDQNTAKQIYTKGTEYAGQGKFNEAKVEFEKTLKVDPYHDSAKRALEIIEDALEQKIKNTTAIHIFKGKTYGIKGKSNEAIVEYNKVIAINPRFAEAYYNRGNENRKKGQLGEAISDYTKAIEMNPRHASACNNRGITYAMKGQWNKAFSDFNKAIEINPRYDGAYANRARVHIKEGQDDKAISDCSKAIEINPRQVEAYYGRAMAYFYKKEYERAWDDVHKAESLGKEIHPKFLKALRQASGRKK